MPTYDYHCQDCGPMEIFQSMKDDTLKRCPRCGSRKFEKLVSSGAGIIFKGDGFWETDYNRSQDYQKQSKTESGGGSSSDSSTGAVDASSSSGASKESKSGSTSQSTQTPASAKPSSGAQS